LPKIVESAAKRPGVDVSIIGHTDTAGKADINEGLALQRALATADLLKAKGLKADALSVESHGERNLLVKTPDETPEPRNRRVEISIR
jgi:outer membrane protein OmpA-like peptidoglycan-associated protein